MTTLTAPLTAPPVEAPPATRPPGFIGNVLRTFAAQSLIFPIHALTGILTARLLGPHDRGLYSLLLMIPQTLDILLRLGIAPANVYMICREKVSSRAVVANSMLLAFGLGALALLVLPFRHVLGETMLASVDGWYLTLAVLMVPFYIAATYLVSILCALNQFQAVNRQMLVGAGARLVMTAVVLLVLHRGLFETFLVNVVGSVLAAAWLLSAVRTATTTLSWRPDLAVATTTVRFGLKSHLQTLLTALHLRLDHFLVAFFLGPSQVAFYALATHMAELINAIDRPVSAVLYPRFASSSPDHIHDTTVTVCRHVLFIEALVGLGLILGARVLILILYGRDYLPAVTPFVVIVPGVVMLSLFNLLARNFMSRDRQRITIVAGAVGLAANALLNLGLIPALGTGGAALASTISYSLATVILLVAFRRESGISLIEMVRPRASDLAFYRQLASRLLARPLGARA